MKSSNTTMLKSVWSVVLVSGLVAAIGCGNTEKTDITVTLRSSKDPMPIGRRPTFVMTLRNISDQPAKILNVKARRDLQDAYCEISISRNGIPLKYIDAISDPGPIADSDYITLQPAQTIEFELDVGKRSFSLKDPGFYTATITFWNYSMSHPQARFKSSSTTFEIKD